MRTVNAYLEKACGVRTIGSPRPNDLIRSSYIDIAKGYRELAEKRKVHLRELAAAMVKAKENAAPSSGPEE